MGRIITRGEKSKLYNLDNLNKIRNKTLDEIYSEIKVQLQKITVCKRW